MLKRFVLITTHGEGATLWQIFDTHTEGDLECVASYSSARRETFGTAVQECYRLNEKDRLTNVLASLDTRCM